MQKLKKLGLFVIYAKLLNEESLLILYFVSHITVI